MPSERTVLSLHISDCSLQLRTHSHPGSIVGALNDVDFSADIVGNSPEMQMRLRIASAWILAIDDVKSSSEPKASSRSRAAQVSDYWRVSVLYSGAFVLLTGCTWAIQRLGFARLVEIRDFAVHIRRNSTPGSVLSKVKRFY